MIVDLPFLEIGDLAMTKTVKEVVVDHDLIIPLLIEHCIIQKK